jgi:nucleoside phosphorylase
VYGALDLAVPRVTPGWTIAPPAACVDAGLPGTVAIVCTGAGKVSAAMQLTRFLESVTPHIMVCGGIAGGINPALGPGDSVIAGRCWFYDRDATAAGIPFGEVTRFQPVGVDRASAAAEEAAVAAAGKAGFPIATIATGDSVVTPELCRSLPAAWQERLRSSDVVDMESAVWVEVAGLYGIVPIICRTVFDLVACTDLYASEPGASHRSITFHAACHRAGAAIAETVRACRHFI